MIYNCRMLVKHRVARRNREELEQYLLSMRTIIPNGCWEWNGGRDQRGYGVIRAGKPAGVRLSTVKVSRVSAMLWLGFDMESKLFILHRCDNPACFNPEHLFVGNQSDNIRDAISKGRAHPAYLRKMQTHCKHGHEYSAENTLTRHNGTRGCRICGRIAAKRNYHYVKKQQ